MGLRFSTEYNGPGQDGVVCLVDSVTDWAFGPVFRTEAEAERFLDYAEHGEGIEDGDVRQLSNDELERLYERYVKAIEPKTVSGANESVSTSN